MPELPVGAYIVKISNGVFSILILDNFGNVYSQDNNVFGQLANGTVVDSNVPTGAVAGLLSDKFVTQITAGAEVTVLTQ